MHVDHPSCIIPNLARNFLPICILFMVHTYRGLAIRQVFNASWMAEFAVYLSGHLTHEVPPLLYKGIDNHSKTLEDFGAGYWLRTVNGAVLGMWLPHLVLALHRAVIPRTALFKVLNLFSVHSRKSPLGTCSLLYEQCCHSSTGLKVWNFARWLRIYIVKSIKVTICHLSWSLLSDPFPQSALSKQRKKKDLPPQPNSTQLWTTKRKSFDCTPSVKAAVF